MTFLLAEMALRTYQHFAGHISFASFLPDYKEKRFALSPFLVFGPRIDFQIPNKLNPEHAYFNSQGFRTRDIVREKKDGEYRIIALGGSTTEDVWNDEGIHWPLILEQTLQKTGFPNVRVLNTAMSAYTTAHTLIRFAFDITEYSPDMIVIVHNINDLMVNYQAARDGAIVDPHYKVLYSTKRYTGDQSNDDVAVSRLLHTVRSWVSAWHESRARPLVENSDIIWGKRYFKRNLSNLIVLARAHNVKVVLLTMPYTRSQVAYEKSRQNARPFARQAQLLSDLAAYNRAIQEVGQEHRVRVVDVCGFVGDNEEYFVDIVHYSTLGVRTFGRILAPKLATAISTRAAFNRLPQERKKH